MLKLFIKKITNNFVAANNQNCNLFVLLKHCVDYTKEHPTNIYPNT